jgi:hypothetical protein
MMGKGDLPGRAEGDDPIISRVIETCSGHRMYIHALVITRLASREGRRLRPFAQHTRHKGPSDVWALFKQRIHSLSGPGLIVMG